MGALVPLQKKRKRVEVRVAAQQMQGQVMAMQQHSQVEMRNTQSKFKLQPHTSVPATPTSPMLALSRCMAWYLTLASSLCMQRYRFTKLLSHCSSTLIQCTTRLFAQRERCLKAAGIAAVRECLHGKLVSSGSASWTDGRDARALAPCLSSTSSN